MKKYIKPAIVTCNINTPAIMAGSMGQIKGEYVGGLPLKSKGAQFQDIDDDDDEEF